MNANEIFHTVFRAVVLVFQHEGTCMAKVYLDSWLFMRLLDAEEIKANGQKKIIEI